MPSYLILITPEANNALRSATIYPFIDTGIHNPDGTVTALFSPDTIQRLDDFKFPHESYSDAIIRLVTRYHSKDQ